MVQTTSKATETTYMITVDSFSSTKVTAYCSGKNNGTSVQLDGLPVISMEQTHSSHFTEITIPSSATILNTDAALTQLPNVHLKVKHADCLPILLYHPLPIIGVVHAGRKGTEQQILKNLLLYIKNNFKRTDSLELWFGPAICQNCYQIDRTKNLHYDLVNENTKQVREVFSEKQANIVYSHRCTAHENEQFYSYRKEGKGVSMNWSGIALVLPITNQ